MSIKSVTQLDRKARHKKILELSYEDTIKYYKFIGGAKNKKLRYLNVYNEDKKMLRELVGDHDDVNLKKITKKIAPVKTISKDLLSGGGKSYNNMDVTEFNTKLKIVNKKINSFPQDMFCTLNPSAADECVSKISDLVSAKTLLEGEYLKVLSDRTKHHWKSLIMMYIEFLLCCGNFYSDSKYNYFIEKVIVPIAKIITSVNEYTNFAMKYINIILNNNPSFYIIEFHNLERDRLDLKKSRGYESKSCPEYIEIVNKQNKLEEIYGQNMIFINKILFIMTEKFKKI